MIKSKKCKLCNKPSFSKGFCVFHAPKKEIKTNSSSIKDITNRKEVEKNEQQIKRAVYFNYHIERCKQSDEDYSYISEPTRSNICHVFDKSRHKSLQDNLENCIYLTQNQHERFDKLLFSLEFEKLEKEFKNSWKKACIIVEKLLPLCSESTVFTRAMEKYLNGKNFKG